MPQLEFHHDPASFLKVAEEYLSRAPVVSTVVSTVADRASREIAAGVTQPPEHWYAVARDDDGAVMGTAMRTAPFAPHPIYVLPMAEPAAVALARAVHERGERGGGVNGALPAARACAEELARLEGGSAVESMHMRLFELHELVPPRPVPGRLRPAGEDEVDLCVDWFEAFGREADAQAGRTSGHVDSAVTPEEMLRRITDGQVVLWEDPSGEVVHLTGYNAPALGVARIGPVYTPERWRGRGYASAAVARVSQELLDAGVRPCLFTDQANPVSNLVYTRLGYVSLVDMVNLVITTPGRA